MVSAKFNKSRTKINISLPIEPLRPSASGKTELIATSGGTQRTDAIHDGRRVHIIANVFVYPQDSKPRVRVRNGRRNTPAEVDHEGNG